MKAHTVIFFLVCLIFGLFNVFSGVAEILYCILAIVVAIVVSIFAKKHIEKNS